jgi:diadenosine tetraphosphate (Ap4A) HIT family hydrolase
MSKTQFLRGYCILRSDPVVGSINDLNETQRAQFLKDMVLAGDAIMEVTGAYRMNYLIAGNFDPLLHAHIVPRYLSEPEQYRKGLPWLYPGFEDEPAQFVAERDAPLMRAIGITIQKHMQNRSHEK